MQRFYAHASQRMPHGDALLGVPAAAGARAAPCRCSYYLAGLTCTEETFMIKAGAQRVAAELGLMLVAPDTSPRAAAPARRRRELGLRARRGLLRRRHAGAVVGSTTGCTATSRASCPALVHANFPVRRGSPGHLRPFDGRSRRAGAARCATRRSTGRCRRSRRSRRRCAARGARRRSPATSARTGAAGATTTPASSSRSAASHGPILIDQGTPTNSSPSSSSPRCSRDACRRAGQTLELRMQPGLRPRLLLHPDVHGGPPGLARERLET